MSHDTVNVSTHFFFIDIYICARARTKCTLHALASYILWRLTEYLHLVNEAKSPGSVALASGGSVALTRVPRKERSACRGAVPLNENVSGNVALLRQLNRERKGWRGIEFRTDKGQGNGALPRVPHKERLDWRGGVLPIELDVLPSQRKGERSVFNSCGSFSNSESQLSQRRRERPVFNSCGSLSNSESHAHIYVHKIECELLRMRKLSNRAHARLYQHHYIPVGSLPLAHNAEHFTSYIYRVLRVTGYRNVSTCFFLIVTSSTFHEPRTPMCTCTYMRESNSAQQPSNSSLSTCSGV